MLHFDNEGNIIFERVVDKLQFESSLYFREGRAVIPEGNKYWYLGTDGRRLPAAYDFAADFNEGAAMVYINNKAGVIDQAGNWVIQPGEFGGLNPFSEAKASARKNDKVGYINTNNEWLF